MDKRTSRQMDGWMNKWIGGWIDEITNEWTDAQIDKCLGQIYE